MENIKVLMQKDHPTLNRAVQFDEILILLRNGEESFLITTEHEVWRLKSSVLVILEQLRRQFWTVDLMMRAACSVIKEQRNLKSLTVGLNLEIKQLVPICGLSSPQLCLYAGHLIKGLRNYHDQTLLDFGDHQYIIDANYQKAKRLRLRANEVAHLMQTVNTYDQVSQHYLPNHMTPQEFHVSQYQAQLVHQRQLELMVQDAHQFLYGEELNAKDLQRLVRHSGCREID
ncbi:hypothetical protein [uncultured Limosilactobacillus sp.]|uniref:hypothetical protein n=1 Tax=uncultured Limosilactobacillus sp. TaxID=2837629 RepID=UPI0026012825|nr:hypothetical protein [uncultured Limosilactobacillus sp.]